jgi:hypothetical protein
MREGKTQHNGLRLRYTPSIEDGNFGHGFIFIFPFLLNIVWPVPLYQR